MTDEIDFIKKELKKSGYPLENYIQAALADRDWHVQPNAYFLDKDTNKGRELDIKAHYEGVASSSWSNFLLQLLVQCRRLPGNAWIFFSIPRRSTFYTRISKYSLADLVKGWTPGIFDTKETHFDKSQVLATNYCEIITDSSKSNKRTNNIWNCVVTLIKATYQELESAHSDHEQFLKEDFASFDEFAKAPGELIYIFYPVIVFEGKMYEAKFFEDNIALQKRDYVQLFVDYQSGHYKGEFLIDVVTKERFSHYLKDIMTDLIVFEKRRLEKCKEYEKNTLAAVKRYYEKSPFFV